MTRGQEGFGKISGLVFLVLLACLLYLGAKFIPVYMDHYQFQGEVTKIAVASGRQSLDKSPETIRREVIARAEQWGITLQPEDVEVNKKGPKVDISLHYKRVVELPGHPVELLFEVEAGDIVIRKLNRE